MIQKLCVMSVFRTLSGDSKPDTGKKNRQTWSTYLKTLAASMLAMFAGAEVVHRYYRPDLSIPEVPPKPGELRTELLGLKARSKKAETSQH